MADATLQDLLQTIKALEQIIAEKDVEMQALRANSLEWQQAQDATNQTLAAQVTEATTTHQEELNALALALAGLPDQVRHIGQRPDTGTTVDIPK